jgi:hypothetical protein
MATAIGSVSERPAEVSNRIAATGINLISRFAYRNYSEFIWVT